MIVYIMSDGKIFAGVYGASRSDLAGVTMISGGAYAVFVDDTLYPDVQTNLADYTIEDIVPDNPSLSQYVPTATGIPVYTPIVIPPEPDEPQLIQKDNMQDLQLEDIMTQTLIEKGIITTPPTDYEGNEYTLDEMFNDSVPAKITIDQLYKCIPDLLSHEDYLEILGEASINNQNQNLDQTQHILYTIDNFQSWVSGGYITTDEYKYLTNQDYSS